MPRAFITGYVETTVKVVGGSTMLELEGGDRINLNRGDSIALKVDIDTDEKTKRELEELRAELRRLCPENHGR